MNAHDKAITTAIKMLTAVGARYHIRTADGSEHGELLDKPEKKRARADKGPSLLQYYDAPLRGLKVGDSITVTAPPDVDKERFVHNAASFARNRYGNGNIVAAYNHTAGSVEILRIE